MRLAIIVEGGVVQSIISDDPEALATAIDDILLVDYDTDGALDSETTPVDQGDGTTARAFVSRWGFVSKADIPLAELAESIGDS
jgi:hypothetical protein